MQRKPKLGQNFLRDPGAAGRIAAALGPLEGRTVVEIGPGDGAITGMLAAAGPRALHLVELDAGLARAMRERYPGSAAAEQNAAQAETKTAVTVTVHETDVLAFDFSSLAQPGPLEVVGNLPYYITSDILLRLTAAHACIRQAVLMVQREVAERVTAQPGGREYGLLSATLQMYGRPTLLFTLPPSAFSPPPQVDSSVFRLLMAPRFAELGVDEAGFLAFLRRCFAHKRKTLHNNLRSSGTGAARAADAIAAAGLPAGVRAEAVDLEAMAALYRRLRPAG